MKNRNFILILVIVGLVALGIYSQKNQEKEEENREIRNYESRISHFDEITDQEFLNDNNELSGYVYVGRKTCSGCRLFLEVITRISLENDIKMKYFDTDKYRESKYYKEILDKYKIDQVPDFLLVKKDGTFERFDQENIKNEEIFENWIIENKDNR